MKYKMDTLINKVRKGFIPDVVKIVSEKENVPIDILKKYLEEGKVIIPNNRKRELFAVGIGKGLRTKVNANIGTSMERCEISEELEKLKLAIKAGADTIMDLSTGGDIRKIRKAIIANCSCPVGTVPIYQVAIESLRKRGSIFDMTDTEMFDIIEEQAEEGVDFITVHCGVTKRLVEKMIEGKERVTNIVSRGGAFLASWILKNKRENPLYEKFSYLLKIAKKFDLTLSLGDGFRPGCIADASDELQFGELIILAELRKLALKEGVQVMIEGPGHLPLDQIEANINLQKFLCEEAPFYVLGPIPTDIAPGYDEITSAIGGAIAAWKGADFLCYVTPSEHIRLPTPQDVYRGTIAAKIAAHVGDLAKGIKSEIEIDKNMAKARKDLDWMKQKKLSIDPTIIEKHYKAGILNKKKACSMCGDFCVFKVQKEML